MNQEDNISGHRYLEAFTARYNKRTKTSKQLAQAYRPVITSTLGPIGFSFTLKELCYPIVVKRSLGSKVWDVDGNEYVDLMMGLGAESLWSQSTFY